MVNDMQSHELNRTTALPRKLHVSPYNVKGYKLDMSFRNIIILCLGFI